MGEERIANELLLKLAIRVSPRTVNKYLPQRPRGRPRGDLRWSTFLRLHAQGIVACDFFVAVTATFRLLYVFVVIEHHSRRLITATSRLIQALYGHCKCTGVETLDTRSAEPRELRPQRHTKHLPDKGPPQPVGKELANP